METDQLKFLQQVITLLPQKRQLFRMHRLEGFSYAEIADLLQISPRTVEDHLSKAMQFIHARFAQTNKVTLNPKGTAFILIAKKYLAKILRKGGCIIEIISLFCFIANISDFSLGI